jgi:ankyrin repeat protein
MLTNYNFIINNPDSGITYKLKRYLILMETLEANKPRDLSVITNSLGFCNGISILYALCFDRSMKEAEDNTTDGASPKTEDHNRLDMIWFTTIIKTLGEWDGYSITALLKSKRNEQLTKNQLYKDIELFLSLIVLFQTPGDIFHGACEYYEFELQKLDKQLGGMWPPSSKRHITPKNQQIFAFKDPIELEKELSTIVLPNQIVLICTGNHTMAIFCLPHKEEGNANNPTYLFFDPNNPLFVESENFEKQGHDAQDAAKEIIKSFSGVYNDSANINNRDAFYALTFYAWCISVDAKPEALNHAKDRVEQMERETLPPNLPSIVWRAVSLVWLATQNGHLDIVKALIEAGDDVNYENPDGFTTPLHLAVKNNHLDIILVLLDSGADAKKADSEGATPLHYAVDYAQDLVRMLIDAGADVNQENNDKVTPLYLAAKNNPSIIPVLLDAGADVNYEANEGFTPLDVAVEEGKLDLVKLLIAAGADVNHETNEGFTPLYVAVEKGQVDLVKILMAAGANVNHEHNDGFSTPLYFAECQGNAEILSALQQYGNRPNSSSFSYTI